MQEQYCRDSGVLFELEEKVAQTSVAMMNINQ
jgi:hypothetical protein